MHDSGVVGSAQSTCNPHSKVQHFSQPHGATAKPFAQRFALQQLRDDVRRTVVLSNMKDGNDIRVTQRGSGLGLYFKPAKAIGIMRPISGQDGFREIMKGTADAALSCPFWTPDGKYLIYRVFHPGRTDIWAVAGRSGLFQRYKQATQITNGPLSYDFAAPSRDGKHIFAIGTKPRGELVRYDARTRQFVPFLGGISAIDPTFSRDGQWVAYTSYSDHTLWRSRTDGTDRLQLTYPPMAVSMPFISPDGKQVSFSEVRSLHNTHGRRRAEKDCG